MEPIQIFLIGLLVLLAVFALGALGFAVPAKPYPPHQPPGPAGPPRRFGPDLPAPVRRHLAETLGGQADAADAAAPAALVEAVAPLVSTAVAWGRGQICVNGVWLPLRFKNWYRVGHDSFRFIEVSWYRQPLLTGRERYVGGEGLVELGGSSERGLAVDQSLNLLMWAEAVWVPSVLALIPGVRFAHSQSEGQGEAQGAGSPGEPPPASQPQADPQSQIGSQPKEESSQPAALLPQSAPQPLAALRPLFGQRPLPAPRWEPVDDHTARLVVPLRLGSEMREDELLAHFDPQTGRMTHFSAQRYRARDAAQEKEPWRVDLLAWKELGGALLPVQLAVCWGESGSPGAYWTLEGIAYNVDVEERLS